MKFFSFQEKKSSHPLPHHLEANHTRGYRDIQTHLPLVQRDAFHSPLPVNSIISP